MLISLVHAIDIGSEKTEANQGQKKYHQKSDREMEDGHGDDAKDGRHNPEHDPNGDEAQGQGDGLGAVKLYERTLVNQKKNQTGNPPEEIAQQSGNILFHSSRGGAPLGNHGRGSSALVRPTLRTEGGAT